MKQKHFYIFIILIFSFFESTSQIEKPTINDWHRTEPTNLTFSYNGDYLITLDSDKTGIITDISKRIIVSKIENVEEDFLSIDPITPKFYTISTNEDSINVQKRNLPSGTIEETYVIPRSLTIDNHPYQIDTFLKLVQIDYTSENLFAIFNKQVVRFSLKNPKNFQFIHGISANQINALVINKGLVYVVTPGQIYRQENDVMKPIITLQNQSNDFFSNIKFDNERLVALSNKYVHWYDTNSFSELEKTSIEELNYSVNGEFLPSGVTSVMNRSHSFEIAENSDVLLVDMSNPQQSPLQKNAPYSLSQINNSITYSIKSEKTTAIKFVDIQSEFAYNSGRNIVALKNFNQIDIASIPHGYLFSVGSNSIPINNMYFTSKPGEILLTTGLSHDELAYLIDIGTTKIEPLGVVESDLYTKYPTHYEHFERIGKPLEIFDYSSNNYSNIPVLRANNENHVLLPTDNILELNYKDATIKFDKNSLILTSQNKNTGSINTTKVSENSGLQEFEKYVFKGYEINETDQLVMKFITSHYGDPVQIWFNSQTGKLIQKTKFKAFKFIDAGQRYMTEDGIFNSKDHSKLKTFTTPTNIKSWIQTSVSNALVAISAEYSEGDALWLYNEAQNQFKLIGRHQNISMVNPDPHSNLMFSLNDNGLLKIWDVVQNKLVAEMVISGEIKYEQLASIKSGMLIMSPGGYYLGSGNYSQMVRLLPEKNYPFSFVDGLYNRPDIILEKLGYADKGFVDAIRDVAERRKSKFQMSKQESDVLIDNKSLIPTYVPAGKNVQIKATIKGPLNNSHTYMVYQNGVALTPYPGKPLKNKSIVENITPYEKINTIRFTLVDAERIETAGDYVTFSSDNSNKGNLHLFAIGVSDYADDFYDLKLAHQDALDISSFFESNNTYLNTYRTTIINAEATKTKIMATLKSGLQNVKPQDQVIVFFAGHGIIDTNNEYYLGTHETNFDNPTISGLPINEVSDLLAGSQALNKLMMIDACHSGIIEDMITINQKNVDKPNTESDVLKRGSNAKNTKTRSSDIYFLFSQFNDGNGVDILSASGAGEFAHEFGNMKNGVFTHNILKGIKSGEADLNRDENISLSELQNYVSEHTLKMTGGRQRPAFRQANTTKDITIINTMDTDYGKWFDAAKMDDIKTMESALADQPSILNSSDDDKFTALHFAARQGSIKAVKFLIDKGAEINIKTAGFGFTPLYLAAINNQASICYLLLDQKAVVADEINLKHTMATLEKEIKTEIVEMIKNFEQVKQRELQHTEFIEKIRLGQMSELNSLFLSNKLNLDYISYVSNVNPVVGAIAYNQPEALRWLFKNGAEPNMSLFKDKYSYLMIATFFDNPEIIKILLENKVDKNAKDVHGKTALDYAEELQKPNSLKQLKGV